MQRVLIVIGAVLLVVGLAWPWLSRLGLGRLPGDIHVETDDGVFFFPIVTCLIISVVVSLVIWFIRRWLRRLESAVSASHKANCSEARSKDVVLGSKPDP